MSYEASHDDIAHQPVVTRRQFLKDIGIGATTLLLTACGGSQPTPSQGAAGDDVPTARPGDATRSAAAPAVQVKENARLQLLGSPGGEWLDYLQNELVPAFQEEAPNVTVEIAPLDWSRINEQLLTAFASGNPPDLFEHGSAASGASWAASGRVMALDPYFESWEQSGDYYQNALETARFDGKLYSIPRLVTPNVIAYRKDFFEEAGLDPETGPETWDDLLEMAKTLTKEEGGKIRRAGYRVPVEDFDGIQQGWYSYLFQNGASAIAEDGTKVAFDSPAGLEALNWYHDLLWKHKVDVLGGLPTGLEGNAVSDAINSGTAAMGIATANILIQAKQNFPDALPQLGFFLPTKRKRQAIMLSIDRIFIAKNTRFPDAAWQFLTFLHRPENLLARYRMTGDIPPIKSTRSQLVSEEPRLETAFEAIDFGVQLPAIPKWNDIRSNLVSMSDAFLTQRGRVEPTVMAAAKEINSILQG